MTKAVVLLAILVVSLAFAPSSTTVAEDGVRLPSFTKLKMNNGLTVLLMEQHEVPIVSFSFIVKTGSVADPRSKEGLAAMTAELLRKGTRTRTPDQIATELDFIGALFDFSASLDFTSGSAEFMKKDMGTGLDLTADIMLNPIFPEAEVRKLITQQIDGIKSAKDRAGSVIGRYFNRYLYGNHPYGRPVNGDELSLRNITREDIQSFYAQHYVPVNTIMAVAGDFNTAEMKSMIEQRFQSWPAQNSLRLEIEQPKPFEGRRLLLIDKPDSTQTYFYIGNLGVSRTNPDRVAISVANTLFGGRFTSRLNTALRVDSGLTYGAHSMFDQRKMAGPFLITTYTRTATTGKAIDMALDILRSFHETGVTQEELDSARTYLKGQFPTSIETSDRLAATIARLEFYGLDESDVNDYAAKLDALTLAGMRSIIRQYFPRENLALVLIGKASEVQPMVRKYASGVDTKSITDLGF